jgi:hypothetical protein
MAIDFEKLKTDDNFFNKLIVRERLTLPVLSFKKNEQLAIKITGEINKSEKSYVDGTGKEKKLGHTCRAINLADGIEYQLILTKVASSILSEYDDYISKCFLIRVTKDLLPGKSYKGVMIDEIVDPTESDTKEQ